MWFCLLPNKTYEAKKLSPVQGFHSLFIPYHLQSPVLLKPPVLCLEVGGSSAVSTVMGIKVQTGHLTTFLSSKGLCPRPQPSSCCHCWIIISKERKFFSPLLVVQHKAGINTKHNILMPPLEHRWTSICLFLYRNLKSKNM